jgi:hypothetical protein
MCVLIKINSAGCQEIECLIPHTVVVLDEQERVCTEAGGGQSDGSGKRLLMFRDVRLIRHPDPAVGTLNDLLLEES